MMGVFTESVVEDAALAWLESLGYAVRYGPEIAPGELFAERGDYGQVILTTRLREALVRLNPALPSEAIDDAFRKITRLEGATLDARNRTFHRLLVDGVTVKHGREIAPGEVLAKRAARVAENATTHMIKTPRATVPERKSLDAELSCGGTAKVQGTEELQRIT